MKYKFIVLILLGLPYSLLANQVLTINIGDKQEIFYLFNGHWIETSQCHGSESCLAKKKLSMKHSNFSEKISTLNTVGGKNPGSVVCTSLFGGEVLIGNNQNGQQTICRFADGSLALTSSLYSWLYNRKNQ